MSVKVTVDVIGLDELHKALVELGSEVAGKNGGLVRTALMGAALPVMKDAKVLVPVSKGEKEGVHLRDAITRSRQKNVDPSLNANEAVDVGLFSRGKGKRVYHGQFVEFGTPLMAARPYLRPALESNRTKSVKLFRKKLAMGVERVAKKIGNENARKVGARIKKL